MKDLDDTPLYELHTMYYMLWKEKDDESKLSKEERDARAVGRAMENIT